MRQAVPASPPGLAASLLRCLGLGFLCLRLLPTVLEWILEVDPDSYFALKTCSLLVPEPQGP